MTKHIFPTTVFPALCHINDIEPVYKYSSYVYSRKAKVLYLIRPKYTSLLPPEVKEQLNKAPVVSINNTECKISLYINEEHPYCHDSCIWQIFLPEDIDLDNSIKVEVDTFVFTAHDIDVYFPEVKDITICTLFKDDYRNSQIFLDYNYYYHDIKSYLLYYNGDVNTLRPYIESLVVPPDANVVFFSINYNYWQPFPGVMADSAQHKELRVKYWAHQSQSVQLSHSCIVANYWSNFLLNIDYDEYIDPSVKLNITCDKTFLYYYNDISTCEGKLCARDYDYSYTDVIPSLVIVKPDKPQFMKYMQRTLDQNIFNRGIHCPYTWTGTLDKKQCLYHIKCLSYHQGKKRYCKPITLS